MIYRVIGLMSGSSLDGLDIVFTRLEEVRGVWSYEILCSECVPYTDKWVNDLKHACNLQVSEFLRLHTAYGKLTGKLVNDFIERNNLQHQVGFVATHGHTVFHEPKNHTTFQLGDGATISAVTGLPVISDLRSVDVALGGQGAPIVPIGDKLLFGNYDYLLNIGGIANITVQHSGIRLAYDVCPANQILNTLANKEGKNMDENGQMAASGRCLANVLDELNETKYYNLLPPKSLSNIDAMEMIFPKLMESNHSTNDLLHTVCMHIAEQVGNAVISYPNKNSSVTMLITGGGAFNQFLVSQIEKVLNESNIAVVVPDSITVKYKEALVMALIGALRWRGETNVLSSVTGAKHDSIGGALWFV